MSPCIAINISFAPPFDCLNYLYLWNRSSRATNCLVHPPPPPIRQQIKELFCDPRSFVPSSTMIKTRGDDENIKPTIISEWRGVRLRWSSIRFLIHGLSGEQEHRLRGLISSFFLTHSRLLILLLINFVFLCTINLSLEARMYKARPWSSKDIRPAPPDYRVHHTAVGLHTIWTAHLNVPWDSALQSSAEEQTKTSQVGTKNDGKFMANFLETRIFLNQVLFYWAFH